MNLGSAVLSMSAKGHFAANCACSSFWDQSDLAGFGGLQNAVRRPIVISGKTLNI